MPHGCAPRANKQRPERVWRQLHSRNCVRHFEHAWHTHPPGDTANWACKGERRTFRAGLLRRRPRVRGHALRRLGRAAHLLDAQAGPLLRSVRAGRVPVPMARRNDETFLASYSTTRTMYFHECLMSYPHPEPRGRASARRTRSWPSSSLCPSLRAASQRAGLARPRPHGASPWRVGVEGFRVTTGSGFRGSGVQIRSRAGADGEPRDLAAGGACAACRRFDPSHRGPGRPGFRSLHKYVKPCEQPSHAKRAECSPRPRPSCLEVHRGGGRRPAPQAQRAGARCLQAARPRGLKCPDPILWGHTHTRVRVHAAEREGRSQIGRSEVASGEQLTAQTGSFAAAVRSIERFRRAPPQVRSVRN